MQQPELSTEAMIARIDELENKVDRLEWENKGIAEWRGEYIHMKEQRDATKAAYAAREEEAHQLSEQIIKLTTERDSLKALAAEPAVWVVETELADLKSCNGRSIWAENPDIWYDENPDHLVPLFRHPAGRQTMNLSEILAERGITLQKTFVEKP